MHPLSTGHILIVGESKKYKKRNLVLNDNVVLLLVCEMLSARDAMRVKFNNIYCYVALLLLSKL